MLDISIVVPIYNERDSLEPLVKALHSTLAGGKRTYEILLVDDGSTDGSWEEEVRLSRAYPALRIIRFRRNFGQTAAISAGFHHARGEIIVTLDADLQNDPADIPRLIERMEKGCDVVSGWRRDRKDPFVNRRLPSILANALISRITGVRLHDYGCTLKAYRRDVVRNIHLYGEMHRFIPALASWVGGQIDEVVVTHHPRRFGKSKYGISRTLRVVLDLITVKFLMRYSTRPIHVFGKWGIASGATGLAMFAFVALANLTLPLHGSEYWGGRIKEPFWIITPFMLVFFGLQFVSMGLLAEIQIRTYHEAQHKPIYVIRETAESPPPAA
jgi:glycosyltransferase involved in cell wall biosynthesis